MDLGIILTLKNILIKNQVYFADPNSFNDPFDCKNDSIYAAINLEKQMKINPSFNTRPSYLGVLSTSLIWDSILMWSHYGNFHKGYNIGFDFKKMKEYFKGYHYGLINYSREYLDWKNEKEKKTKHDKFYFAEAV